MIFIADRVDTNIFDETKIKRIFDSTGYRQSNLNWLCDFINKLYKENESWVLFPLGPKHSLDIHMAMENVWILKEKAAYEKDRTLPFYAFNAYISEGKKRHCVILNVWNLFVKDLNVFNHCMKIERASWTRPRAEQLFIIIGGLWNPDFLEGCIRQPDYLFLSSQFTKHLDNAEFPKSEIKDHQDDEYFRRELWKNT